MTIDAVTQSISSEDFKSAFRNHPAGVAVLTALAGEDHAAMTVSSLFSISAEPPLIGFSVSDMSSAAGVFNAASTIVIHMVDANSLWLAKLGATSGARRFEDPTSGTSSKAANATSLPPPRSCVLPSWTGCAPAAPLCALLALLS